VRAEIEKEIIRADSHKRFELAPTTLEESQLEAQQKNAAQLAREQHTQGVAVTKIAQRFRDDEITSEAARLPADRWHKITRRVADYFNSFQMMPDFDEV